jgi:2-oxoisovalerate dehydrogenase E1 component alpha subunit
MSHSLIRILDDQGGTLPDSRLPDLQQQDLLQLYQSMLLIRRIDERMTKLQRQGRIGFYVGSTGEEAAIIGSSYALRDGDWLVPCYREAGAALLRGYSLYDFVSQIYGNSEDKMKGRQMPCHWASPEKRLLSVSSPVGTQIPQATGIAMAATLKGSPEVVLVYFGDGATSAGDFHVACNFAGVYQAPVIFFCRNNQWAISTPQDGQTASRTIADKAIAYGFEGTRVDGNDVLAVYQITLEAVEKARRGEGPTLVEALTYRQGAHSTSDDPRAYRDDAEVEEWRRKDPLARFRRYLTENEMLTAERDQELEAEIKSQIQSTLQRAESIGPPPKSSLVEDVFDTVPWHLQEQLEQI